MQKWNLHFQCKNGESRDQNAPNSIEFAFESIGIAKIRWNPVSVFCKFVKVLCEVATHINGRIYRLLGSLSDIGP